MDSRDSGREEEAAIQIVREVHPRGSRIPILPVEGGIGWKTVLVFSIVIGAGVAVFAFLPAWVAERKAAPADVPAPELSAESIAEQAPPPAPEIEEATPPPEPAKEVVEEPSAEMPPEPPSPEPTPVEPAPAPDESEREFQSAMAEGLRAIDRKDYQTARSAFERARAARPGAPEVARGLAQVEEGLRANAIALHRERAEELEANESFREAQAEYDAALAIDPTLRFAREGRARAEFRSLLAEKLAFQVSHPERLTDPRAHEEASRLLDEARAAGPAGAKHQASVQQLEALLASFSTPVTVQILSDGLTEVSLYRVGPIGKFERKLLELRPGSYVAIGSRAGFKDVRISFSVEPGKPAPQVVVRCEEKI